MALPVLSATDARTLLLAAQALLDDPERPATPRALSKLIDRLGFVQVDSINVVDRGHHLTLGARLAGYRPEHLTQLLEQRRSLFEHWTHDASVIPTSWFPMWKLRFRKFATSNRHKRWVENRIGENPRAVIGSVERRLRREGPLMSADFEADPDQPREAWWGWTPQKTALELLLHTGRVSIAGRRSFNKIYDLTERVLPEASKIRCPGPRAHREWACTTAIERLGVAAPGEIAHFWEAIPPADAAAWCKDAEREGRIVAVRVEDAADGKRRPAYAVVDWERKLARAPEPKASMRLLSPFDPVIRDRRRLLRRFDFDYRFEAFVPKEKRTWGYYVLPLLEGDRFVGRLDPKFHRDADMLEIRSLHWEKGVPQTRARRRGLDDALAVMARRIGARRIDLPPSAARAR
jgi:uncharacterized protein YcaQ